MEHITTISGEKFAPLNPDVNRIKIEDIAHALSMVCRGNGHVKRFYSVAQHCVNCANEAKARGLSVRIQLACLIHDGSEAYVSDITRPLKRYLTEYLEIEHNLQEKIYEKFLGTALSDEEEAHVKQIDDDLLAWEFDVLKAKKLPGPLPAVSSKPSLELRDFKDVENEFLSIFNECTAAHTK